MSETCTDFKTYTYSGNQVPEGTIIQIPQYTYLDSTGEKVVVPEHNAEWNEDGTITLSYEEIAAMERLRRQPAASVVMNNVVLGGTPTKDKNGDFTEITDPATTVTNNALTYQGYVFTTLVENNYYEYLDSEVLADAEAYDYDIYYYKYEEFAEVMDDEGYKIIEDGYWYDCGLTFDYDYSIWH